MFSSFLDVLRRVDQILQTVDGQSQAQNQTLGSTAPSFQFQGIVMAHRFFLSDYYCIWYLYIYRTDYVAFVDKLDYIIPLHCHLCRTTTQLKTIHFSLICYVYAPVKNKFAVCCVSLCDIRYHMYLIDCSTDVINTWVKDVHVCFFTENLSCGLYTGWMNNSLKLSSLGATTVHNPFGM
jgi:hypothetical protein